VRLKSGQDEAVIGILRARITEASTFAVVATFRAAENLGNPRLWYDGLILINAA